MKLYIVRHGETEWNVRNRLQGRKDSDLTEQGIINTERLLNRLKDIEFDCIYSSPQKRAIDTAKILKSNSRVELKILKNLGEIRLGVWEGMYIDDIKKKYKEEYMAYLNTPHLYRPLGGESFKDIFIRVEDSLRDIIDNGGKNILIVSHGITIRILTAIIKKIPLEELHKIPTYEGTALNICKVKENEIKFLLEGDTLHIR